MTAIAKFNEADYGRLLSKAQPVVIQTEKEFWRITKEIDALVKKQSRTPEEERLLDLLSDLSMRYEETHHPIPNSTPLEILQFLIEENDLVPAQLAKELGVSRGVLGDILKGRRGISKELAKALAARFKLRVDAFI